jgi:exportin-1
MADLNNMGVLLDFNQEFNVQLLDLVVESFYNPSHPKHIEAKNILTTLQQNPASWTKVSSILENSQKQESKFLALQILGDTILYRWKAIADEARQSIKDYVVRTIIELSKTPESLQQSALYLKKLNVCLVQILKQEWPDRWPNFIEEIVSASKSGESICENNMRVLKLLSEEVFEFSEEAMVSAKIKKMKESLNNQFGKIFELCLFVLRAAENVQSVDLLKVTLETLERFTVWIPLGYLFETELIQILVGKFLTPRIFRSNVLAILTELVSLKNLPINYQNIVCRMYTGSIEKLTEILPANTSIKNAYAAAVQQSNEGDQSFVRTLALYLTAMFTNHLKTLENLPAQHPAILSGMNYLGKISEVENDVVFKICLGYWHKFTGDLYQAQCAFQPPKAVLSLSTASNVGLVGIGGFGNSMSNASANNDPNNPKVLRNKLYQNILSHVRGVLISSMVKPEEVLIVENEDGAIVRETTKDTDALAQYKTMREALVFLTHLNYEDTELVMLDKLSHQVDGTDWSRHNLNTLCWAIGSISGAMAEEDEKRFLVTVIKDLLGLCEKKRGKDNKAVVASNIMYVVGQYPRFLRNHWKFLKTVVNKQFEFMHELHPGVRDMAVDTFLKIAKKCRRKFVVLQDNETQPFINELLSRLPTEIADLEPHQVQTYYEAVGYMIASQRDTGIRNQLIEELMKLPNVVWQQMMTAAKQNVNTLHEVNTIKEVAKIMRTNIRACSSIGAPFVIQLGKIYLDMLNVYKAYSEFISNCVKQNGQQVTQQANIRAMRAAKTETLNLIETFIEKYNTKSREELAFVTKNFIPHLIEPVLGDYQKGIPAARDAQVLSLFATIINKMKSEMTAEVPNIFQAVLMCTLQMISQNFEDFPEHRINFYKLLKAVVEHCFAGIFNIPPAFQKSVVDSIVWGFKHTERNIANLGLEILLDFLRHVEKQPSIAQQIYQSFYIPILKDVLFVLTDRLHKSQFKMQTDVLRHMCSLVESGAANAPLWNPQVDVGMSNNQQYVRTYVAKLLANAFPNLAQQQVQVFVMGFFDMNKNDVQYKQHVRDFLISLREFSGEDNKSLYTDEVEQQKKAKADADRIRRAAVPGLLNPVTEINDDDL